MMRGIGRRFNDLRFGTKLVVVLTATSTVMLLLASACFTAYEWRQHRHKLVEGARSIAEIVAAGGAGAILFADPAAGEEMLRALGAEEHVEAAALVREDGTILSTYRRPGAGEHSFGIERGHRFEDGRLVLGVPVIVDGSPVGTVVLKVDTRAMEERFQSYLVLTGLILVASVGLSVGIASVVQRPLTGPILGLARAARAVSASREYDLRVTGEGRDEVGDLVRAFNRMLEQIRRRDQRLRVAQDELEQHVKRLEGEIRERQEAQAALRASEERRRQSQKMEAIGVLAGGVAHDFNNILTAITGHAQLLGLRLGEGSRHQEAVEEIVRAAERAAVLTRQLLAFSRKQVIELKPLEVNTVPSGLAKMLNRVIGERIRLKIELDAEAGWIRGDAGQMEQAVMNLVVNARDAMPEGGVIRIATRREVLDEQIPGTGEMIPAGDYAVLSVSDTGVGIPETDLPHIFEPFFTTKGVGKGTGLGLATVFGAIKQGEGYIVVRTGVGTGTTFDLYLPRRAGQGVEVRRRVTESQVIGGRERVLLVEDQEQVRDVAEKLLARCGYEVHTAADGDSALEIVRGLEGCLNLLLTDVIMPGMNGRELADRVLELRPGTPVLYMSGYSDDIISDNGVLGDGISLIHKPFTLDTLATRVREILDARARNAA